MAFGSPRGVSGSWRGECFAPWYQMESSDMVMGTEKQNHMRRLGALGHDAMTKNDDFLENLEVRKLISYGVRWTPRALLWAQKYSGNIPRWFLSDFGTSENF